VAEGGQKGGRGAGDDCSCVRSFPAALPPTHPPHPPPALLPSPPPQGDIYDADPLRSLFCAFPPPVSFIQQQTVLKSWASEGRLGRPLYDVVGPTNQMQSAECDTNCFWNSKKLNATSQVGLRAGRGGGGGPASAAAGSWPVAGVTSSRPHHALPSPPTKTQDAEFTIEFDQLKSWIDDVKAITHKDLWRNDTRSERCAGGGYIWVRAQGLGGGTSLLKPMAPAACRRLLVRSLTLRTCRSSPLLPQLRFGRGSDDYLGTTQGLKRPVYVQSTWLRNTQRWEYPSGWPAAGGGGGGGGFGVERAGRWCAAADGWGDGAQDTAAPSCSLKPPSRL
jgi:hypothetical protein